MGFAPAKTAVLYSAVVAKSRDEYNAYMRVYMLNRYHSRRTEAIAILGGSCVRCGTTEDLQIDHIDPRTKTMDIGHLWSIAKSRYLKELQLCQLLCVAHHREKTGNEQSVPHGGGLTGKRNCLCKLCKPKKAEYQRERRARLRS